MANPFIGEIRVVAFNFAPTGWAMCNGQLMAINQNTALFSLLGTQFGGNGTTTFALPNLQGCAPMDQGNGAGLSQRVMGETAGETAVTVTLNQVPSHSHAVAVGPGSNANTPTNAVFGSGGRGKPFAYAPAGSSSAIMNQSAVGVAGGGQPHNNLPPYLTLNFIIALQGIFPSRS